MGRKIPGRKHRGIRDPEKQAIARLESIKDKINAPPSNVDNQEVPKSLQRIIDLKNKVKSGDYTKRKKKVNNKPKVKSDYFGKPDKPAREFTQLPNESDKDFVRRMNKICMDVVKEADFENKFGVEIKRNEKGEIEGVVRRQKDELELLIKQLKKKKKEKKGNKKTKKSKEKDKGEQIKLSKWQKRKMKLKEKEERKEMKDIDEFKQYKDNVKFGEIAHAPPSLVTPRKTVKHETVHRPGNKNLLLKSMLETDKKSTISHKPKTSLNKESKVIDKKGKRRELPNSLRRQLDQQQKEIINAYKELKAKKYK